MQDRLMISSKSSPVSASLDFLVKLSGLCPGLWTRLGNMESALLADRLPAVHSPVYICGLARSGSTLLLEILAAHPDAATHRYRDFPFITIPYWWDRAISLNPLRDRTPRERAHGDGMQITPDSPEAMEEMLWMAFFPDMHNPKQSQVMNAESQHPAFERFYRQHIQKLLLARKGARYIAKGNYNITRMAYLMKLFPDARFIIPVREPASHIASLMRQHKHFSALGKSDARVVTQMSKAGHFEFGLNRKPIHTGDEQRIKDILRAWEKEEEVRGWALYWDMIYSYLHRQIETHGALKKAALIVRLETLSTKPEATISAMLAHCNLREAPELAERFSPSMHETGRTNVFSAEEQKLIQDITGITARLYGYV